MNQSLSRKLIGGAAVVIGLAWSFSVIVPHARAWLSVDKASLLPCLFAIPGIGLMALGRSFWKGFNESVLRWILGIPICIVCLSLSGLANESLPAILPGRAQFSMITFLGALIAIILHLHVLRALIRYFTGECRKVRSLPSRGILILMSIQLYSLLSQLVDPLENEAGLELLDGLFFQFLIPLLIAIFAYRKVTSWKLAESSDTADRS